MNQLIFMNLGGLVAGKAGATKTQRLQGSEGENY